MKFSQDLFSVWCKFQENLPSVVFTLPPHDRTTCNEPVRQFNSTVVSQAKSGRHRCYCRTSPLRQALNGEQQLVLLRLESVCSRRFLAEVEKLTNLIGILRFADTSRRE